MSGPGLAHEPDHVRSFDGTTIAVRSMGTGELLPVLLSNAIGANLAVWRRAIGGLVAQHRIVTWDHRGLHESALPASDRLDPAAHAEDAIAAADHAGIERFAVAAWSNGGRIALELADSYPDRVAALVLVCAGYGQPFGRLRYFEPASLLPLLASAARPFSSLLERPLGALAAKPELAGFIRQSGLVAASADTSALVELFRGLAACDTRMFLDNYRAVAGDAAFWLLETIELPTLVIAGSRDVFAPVSMMREMTEAIADARLEVYEGATHYLPIEFAARLSEDLRTFLAELPAPA